MNRWKRILVAVSAAGVAVGCAGGPVAAQALAEHEGAAGLGLALRRLGTTKRVLMIGAHPDDENTAVLASFALGQGADAAYLALTRGEGGQNLIGSELQEGLGLLRTEELLAARRLDGATQFFTRAYDFGYSKTADESFEHWPRERLLADVVEVIRRFRPDIVIPSFTGTPRDGHGHHQVSGIVAREAIDAAADPARFPDQLRRGLLPHATPRVMNYRGGDGESVTLEVGAYDPLLGRSHYQLAMASRSRHRSQDMGSAQPPGPRDQTLTFERGAPAGAAASAFAGLDTTLSQLVAGTASRSAELVAAATAYERAVADARAAFNPLEPDATLDALVGANAALAAAALAAAGLRAPRGSTAAAASGAAAASAAAASGAGEAGDDPFAPLVFRIETERAQLGDALWRAAGLVLLAESDDERVVPGQSFGLTLSLWNGGPNAIRLEALEPVLPGGWRAEPLDGTSSTVAPGALLRRRFRVRVAADASPSEAYFLERPRDGDLYVWPADADARAQPFEPAPVRARARVSIEAGPAIEREVDAEAVEVDQASGEIRTPVLVVPAGSVELTPGVAVVPAAAALAGGAERRLSVRIASEAVSTVEGSLSIQAPAGWRIEPRTAPVRLESGAVAELSFRVEPPDSVAAGTYSLDARLTTDRGDFTRGYRMIDYPHTLPRPLYSPATVRVVVVDVALPDDLRIGYIAGAGDQVADALRQLGARVDLLDEAALADARLEAYDAIVTGIRAYEVRSDLAAHNERLLEYVRRGGTFVVQYNQYQFSDSDFPPHPITIARPHGRVTDETAPVELLQPSHPILSWPNRIGAADFEGWIQERGLYFADTWADAYTPLLSMHDPGEQPLRGSLLVAQVGEGTYVYTGLAFFRQTPVGVAGVYRLLANLVSLGRARR